MSTMESICDSSNDDEEVGVGKVPKMVFNDHRRGIGENGSHISVENGLEIGRSRHRDGGTDLKGKT